MKWSVSWSFPGDFVKKEKEMNKIKSEDTPVYNSMFVNTDTKKA